MKRNRSQQLFQQAQKLIPGGVNSPVRACQAVGGAPLFIDRAQGCWIFDADGNAFIDYVGSWGPMILGHRHPAVVEAVVKTLEKGLSYGAPTELENQLAELIIEALPSVELVRMVNSGTEATMSAIRLARGITGRDLIVKFDGCYHGHADTLLVAAGSGVATLGIPGSPGVPQTLAAQTLSLPFNDIQRFETLMAEKGDQVAGVIVEPVAGNMGLVPPSPNFLATLRQLTRRSGSLLIFDEVMTGFRVAYGGAQVLYDLMPDITTLGKIIGGGLPVGAYGGPRDIMGQVAPQGQVYQAGTLSGNPVAMAAGIATLSVLKQPNFYDDLDRKSDVLCQGLQAAADAAGLPARAERVGSMLGFFFSANPVRNFADAKRCDLERFAAFYQGLLQEGIYVAPSQFEALFVSAAHGSEEIERSIAAVQTVLTRLAG